MLLTFLKAVGLADALDIALVTVLIYALLVWFKRARAAFVAKGMLVLAGVYLFSRATGMYMTTSLFHGFFAILLVALVVIFQEELRSLFERIAVWSLSGGQTATASPDDADTLARTVGDLARDRIGALIVLRGRDPLDRHLEGGWPLGGAISEALLKSIFDDHSIGHDGAVVIQGRMVERFGARLPLSKDLAKTAKLGTRHTAALGLVELTDAMCIVVSEERGTVSLAQDGRLEAVRKLPELQGRIQQFIREKAPLSPQENLKLFLRRNWREKAMAFSSAVLLWVLFVLGAKDGQMSYEMPVQARNVPSHLAVEALTPPRVRATFAGQMRDFYWVDRSQLAVRLDLSHAAGGPNRLALGEGNVIRPARFNLLELDPAYVEVVLGPRGTERRQGGDRW